MPVQCAPLTPFLTRPLRSVCHRLPLLSSWNLSLVSVIIYSAGFFFFIFLSCTFSNSFMGSFFWQPLRSWCSSGIYLFLSFHATESPCIISSVPWVPANIYRYWTSISGVPTHSLFRPPGTYFQVLEDISTHMSHRHFKLSISKTKQSIFAFSLPNLPSLPIFSYLCKSLHLHHCLRHQGVILKSVSPSSHNQTNLQFLRVPLFK